MFSYNVRAIGRKSRIETNKESMEGVCLNSFCLFKEIKHDKTKETIC